MQKIITLFLATFLVAVSSANADFELIGSGWKVTGLHDTAVGVGSNWFLNGEAITFTAPPKSWLTGEYRYSTDDDEPIEGRLVFSTNFTVQKLVENPLTETAHIAFSLWTSEDVTSILINGQAVDFSDTTSGKDKGWYDFLLSSELFTDSNLESFTLEFVYDPADWGQKTVLDFGVKFNSELSSITSTTPEPATLLILGLGLAGLGLARRRR